MIHLIPEKSQGLGQYRSPLCPKCRMLCWTLGFGGLQTRLNPCPLGRASEGSPPRLCTGSRVRQAVPSHVIPRAELQAHQGRRAHRGLPPRHRPRTEGRPSAEDPRAPPAPLSLRPDSLPPYIHPGDLPQHWEQTIPCAYCTRNRRSEQISSFQPLGCAARQVRFLFGADRA